MELNKSIFWDVDYENIDWNKQSRFVIARVLMRGGLNDWFAIKKFYGLKKIKSEVSKIRYLDKLTLNFCIQYFDLPKEKFRCYNTVPSIQKLWDY